MPVLTSLLIGLALGALLAGAAGAYLWHVWRPRREVFEGRRILAGMRWRELSNLVVDALASAGFEPGSNEKRAEHGLQAELIMQRDGRPWLLACKQGLDHRIGAPAVEDMLRDVRRHQAAGAVMVTPGHVEPSARSVASNVELADGTELWRLLEPHMPPSVIEEVGNRARAQTYRHAAVVLAASAIAVFAVTWALSQFEPASAPTAAPVMAPAAPAPAEPAPMAPAEPTPASTLTEDEQRRELAERLSALPGVDRALWPTRSTLQIFVTDPTVATDTAICQLVERYDVLRASRLQLQPPAGDDRPVRFMQCQAY